MARRLTDSRKWEDGWFIELDPSFKLMWVYVLDKCDHAGIYKSNRRIEEACLGFPLDLENEIFIHRIKKIDTDKYFIPKFIEFQYRVNIHSLNDKVSVQRSVIEILKKERVIQGLSNPSARTMNKDKNKDMDKDKGGMGGEVRHDPVVADELHRFSKDLKAQK